MVSLRHAPTLATFALLTLAIPGAVLLHHAPAAAAPTPGATAASTAPDAAAPQATPLPQRIYMPTVQQAEAQRALGPARSLQSAAGGPPLLYHGGPVTRVPHVILVFWGFHPTGVPLVDHNVADPSGEELYLERFFGGVGGSHWAGVQDQYTDTTGAITNPAVQFSYPTDVVYMDPPANGWPAVLPDALLDSTAVGASDAYWGVHGYNANDQFMIATPHGSNTAEFGVVYCAYHTTVAGTGGHTVPYTNLPYMTDMPFTCGSNAAGGGNLDGVSIVAGHEFEESVTDPYLNAWYDASGQENADKCAWLSSGPGRVQLITFSTGTFAVQGNWSNAISDCAV